MYEEKLKEKKEIVQKIFFNTQQQTQIIQEEDEEKLLPLLHERQELIQELECITQQIQEIKSRIKITQEQKDMETKIQKKLQQVYDQEIKNQQQMEKNRQELYQNIQDLQQSKKAMAEGYRKQQVSTYGYFIDKKN